MTTKRVVSLIAVFVLFWGTACDKFDRGTDPPSTDPDTADAQGNLVIKNLTGQRLVLYRGGEERLKIIPDDLTDYVVAVPNPNGDVLDLRVFRLGDVSGSLDMPTSSALLKRWAIPLASDYEAEHRSTWVIKDDDAETDSGTLTLGYVGGTENSVDIYLDSKNGAKIASLRPGAVATQVGVDYGTYTVLYNYWYSDPNSANAIEGRGWTDTEVVNDDEVPIYIVLNANRTRRHVQVPHQGVQLNPWGTITVQNTTSKPVQLWVGQQLIEHVVYTDGSRVNLSTLAANETAWFTLPTGIHAVIAKDPVTTGTVSQESFDIRDGSKFSWDVGTGEVTDRSE